MRRVSAAEIGMALGLLIGLILVVMPLGKDDFSRVFWPAAQLDEPYSYPLWYPYPAWNTWYLHLFALYSRETGLLYIWILTLAFMFRFVRVWGTPAWVVLISPPFLFGMFFGHPFEALFFVGISLCVIGLERDDTLITGVGLCLMLFKPQLAFLPGLFICLALLKQGRWEGPAIPLAWIGVITAFDWIYTERLWIDPWLEVMRQMPAVEHWNASLWIGFYWGSLLWVPVGIWALLKMARGNTAKELWVVTAAGLLLSPYWAGYSLWPLVAMSGCWRKESV